MAEQPTKRPRWMRLGALAYGGDYNPEQWPESVWAEDVRLMTEAGVNLVTVGVFSWALLEPAEGRFDFGWLDRVVDMLHDAGIAVDLATPTAAPPAWLYHRYPAIRPVSREGHVLGLGARGTFCPSSPEYAAAATRIVEQLANRYGEHPALVLWHVHNEYGNPVPACYCETSAEAFRGWLRDRYGGLDALNDAWGTTFWGQHYGEWAEIEPPRIAATAVNPSQQLDYMRFSSDALLDCFRLQRDILHRLAPETPVTTNFMATMFKSIDYWRWAQEVDVVSNDHYLRAERTGNHIDLAMAADLTRSLADGQPWLLMEHSTSAVNWQPRNIAKRPGEMRRNSLSHVARGADGALFFQWRASRFGAEKFHSAMLPRGGTTTRIWRDVVSLGRDLATLSEMRGSRVVGDVGVVWDWQSWWAMELEWRPSVDLSHAERMSAFYDRLWRAHHTVDFVPPEADLRRYALVVVPSLYLATPAAGANLTEFVRGGGTLVVSCFSGIVNAADAFHPGPFPGALRDVLGLEVEEFLPLRADEIVLLDDGSEGRIWAEHVILRGAEAMRCYADGPAAGGPAVTRHRFGDGIAWYVSTALSGGHLDLVLEQAYRDARLPSHADIPDGLEVVRRVGDDASYVTLINHGDADVVAPADGTELVTGSACTGAVRVPAGEVRVVRQR